MEQDPQIVAPTTDAGELGTREQDTPSPDIVGLHFFVLNYWRDDFDYRRIAVSTLSIFF